MKAFMNIRGRFLFNLIFIVVFIVIGLFCIVYSVLHRN